MLNIPGHKVNANQTQTTINVGEDVGKKGALILCWWE
jgi:hypothetical protein